MQIKLFKQKTIKHTSIVHHKVCNWKIKKTLFKTKAYETPYDYKQGAKRGRHVARNSQLTGLFWGVWGRSPQPLEAIGGLGAKPPTAGGTGVWGRSPQRLKILHFFLNNLILGLYWWKIMLLKLGIEIGSAINCFNGLNCLHKWAMWKVANGKILALLFTCW